MRGERREAEEPIASFNWSRSQTQPTPAQITSSITRRRRVWNSTSGSHSQSTYYVTEFAKRTISCMMKCMYLYFRNTTICDPNQTWVFALHHQEIWGRVHGICDCGEFFNTWSLYTNPVTYVVDHHCSCTHNYVVA